LYLYSQDKIAEDPVTHGSMFVPIILGSDKTTVSVATGHNEYYPLYMSIGNVHNNVRRAHRNALVLVAFLAIPERTCYTFSWSHVSYHHHFSRQEACKESEVPILQTPCFSYIPCANTSCPETVHDDTRYRSVSRWTLSTHHIRAGSIYSRLPRASPFNLYSSRLVPTVSPYCPNLLA
jgi:hypothetical protein